MNIVQPSMEPLDITDKKNTNDVLHETNIDTNQTINATLEKPIATKANNVNDQSKTKKQENKVEQNRPSNKNGTQSSAEPLDITKQDLDTLLNHDFSTKQQLTLSLNGVNFTPTCKCDIKFLIICAKKQNIFLFTTFTLTRPEHHKKLNDKYNHWVNRYKDIKDNLFSNIIKTTTTNCIGSCEYKINPIVSQIYSQYRKTQNTQNSNNNQQTHIGLDDSIAKVIDDTFTKVADAKPEKDKTKQVPKRKKDDAKENILKNNQPVEKPEKVPKVKANVNRTTSTDIPVKKDYSQNKESAKKTVND